MSVVKSFLFNPFDENTYVIHDETGECIIVDPGCYMEEEREELVSYIEREKLKPVKLLNTHCHVDHVFGNKFLAEKYQLKIEAHELDVPLLSRAHAYGEIWGVHMEPSPLPEILLNEGEQVKFGHTTLDILFTPGHSPGSICFYSANEKYVISGDVLFQMSIGRTDLPGGDFDTLIRSIREKLFTLPNDVKVYSGHGPSTTIGFEKMYNPYLNE